MAGLKVASELTWHDLSLLMQGEILALRIPNYCSRDARAAVLKAINEKGECVEKYGYEPKVGKIGAAFVETKLGKKHRESYFESAGSRIKLYRSWCGDYLGPFDKFRLQLDEISPAGVGLARFSEGMAFAGLIRVIDDGGFGAIHQDRLKRAASHEPLANRLVHQIAVNIHLQVATDGGELEIWDLRPSFEEYVQMKRSSPAGMLRSILPTQSLLVKPETDDLILFEATNLHAVRQVEGQTRVTWSAFLGYESDNTPLTIWS